MSKGMFRSALALVVSVALLGAMPALARQDDRRLDTLFADLQAASGPEAQKVQGQIWEIWFQSGSDTVDLLMADAGQATNMGLNEQAEEQYDAIIDLAPDFAEGWNRRATLRFMRGNYSGSIADINQVLELEPRHFGALAGLGAIYDKIEQPEAALHAFREALLINPHMAEVRKRADEIAKQLKDREI
ncbi:MAG: hypothetical protein VYB54_13900 [Pseudomonadota bacterium]|nr:hypothetical protein [Pseudomonadota bacterium]